MIDPASFPVWQTLLQRMYSVAEWVWLNPSAAGWAGMNHVAAATGRPIQD